MKECYEVNRLILVGHKMDNNLSMWYSQAAMSNIPVTMLILHQGFAKGFVPGAQGLLMS
jgi:hypothetical protein